MTVPANVRADQQDAMFPLESPQEVARPDPTPLLERALAAQVSPDAFRMFTAAVLRAPLDRWVTVEVLSQLAGYTPHQGRAWVAELVDAGLVLRQRMRGIVDGRKRDQKFYRVAVRS